MRRRPKKTRTIHRVSGRTLTFEFPNSTKAQDFFEFCNGPAKLNHRVVETECGDDREVVFAREGAKQFGGFEAK